MIENIKELLEILEQYFIYLYPGYITLFIYYFSKAKKIKYKRIFLSMCVIISYVYTLLYRFVIGKNVLEFREIDYIIILCISIIVPTAWNWISQTKWLEMILEKLRFDTSVEDNVWDFIQYRDKERAGIVLKVFLDEKGLMYEGSLRYRENDPESGKNICLSGFRRYVKQDDKYVVKLDYDNDNSHWVLVNIEDITRTEIKYDSEK